MSLEFRQTADAPSLLAGLRLHEDRPVHGVDRVQQSVPFLAQRGTLQLLVQLRQRLVDVDASVRLQPDVGQPERGWTGAEIRPVEVVPYVFEDKFDRDDGWFRLVGGFGALKVRVGGGGSANA
uniref:(northern house mosquito) hypothetical protein n=1 Tax=Culex pipiens TaxID=7175 RepID=A0A8D8A798_CULPI